MCSKSRFFFLSAASTTLASSRKRGGPTRKSGRRGFASESSSKVSSRCAFSGLALLASWHLEAILFSFARVEDRASRLRASSDNYCASSSSEKPLLLSEARGFCLILLVQQSHCFPLCFTIRPTSGGALFFSTTKEKSLSTHTPLPPALQKRLKWLDLLLPTPRRQVIDFCLLAWAHYFHLFARMNFKNEAPKNKKTLNT